MPFNLPVNEVWMHLSQPSCEIATVPSAIGNDRCVESDYPHIRLHMLDQTDVVSEHLPHSEVFQTIYTDVTLIRRASEGQGLAIVAVFGEYQGGVELVRDVLEDFLGGFLTSTTHRPSEKRLTTLSMASSMGSCPPGWKNKGPPGR